MCNSVVELHDVCHMLEIHDLSVTSRVLKRESA